MKPKNKLLLVLGISLLPISLMAVAVSCSAPVLTKKDATKEAAKVTLDIANKVNKLPSEVSKTSTFAQDKFDKEKYELKVQSVKVGSDRKSIVVTFRLKVKNTDVESEDKKLTITGFKEAPTTPTTPTVLTKDDANKEATKVTFDFANKRTTLASAVSKTSTFVQENFDKEKYELKVQSVEVGGDKVSIIVTFRLKVKNTDVESDDKTLTITGFKETPEPVTPVVRTTPVEPVKPTPAPTPVLTKEDANNEAAKVTFDFANKTTTLASEVSKTSTFIQGKFDKEKYELKVQSVEIGGDKVSIIVTFRLKVKNTDVESDDKTFTITGFKEVSEPVTPVVPTTPVETEPAPTRSTVLTKDDANTNETTTLASAVSKTSTFVQGEFDEKKYELEIQSVVVGSDKKSIIVTFRLKVKNTDIKSDDKTLTFTGFKEVSETVAPVAPIVPVVPDKPIIVQPVTPVEPAKPAPAPTPVLTKEDANNQAAKVTFDFANKTTTLTSSVSKTSTFIQGEFDEEKYELKVQSVEVGGDKVSIIVTFRLKVKNTDVESDDKTFTITGFKETPEPVAPDPAPTPVPPAGEKPKTPSNPSDTDGTRPKDKVEGTSDSDPKTPEQPPKPDLTNIFKNAKPVENSKFNVTSIWSRELFGYNTEGSNSYRIPGIIKTSDGKVIINADKRIENAQDNDNTIEQVQKVSKDNGETWTKNQTIVRVGTPKTNKGLIIDGTMVESIYEGKNKLIYLFNIFPEREGIKGLFPGTPWLYLEDEAYWKVWLKDNGKDFNKDSYLLKELSSKPGWFQLYKLQNQMRHHQVTKKSQLTPINTFVDNTYNPETKTITGQVYENISEADLNDPEKVKAAATNNSVYDKIINGTKYLLSRNNHNATLESTDGGVTWKNLRMIDRYLSKDRPINPLNDNTDPFNGNAVGSGIQLKHQKNTAHNGRIIFPMYSYNNGVQKAYFIYSDDGGTTWHNKFISGLQRNSTEATFNELEDGSLIWLQRQSISGQKNNKPSVTKSVDGGMTWFNPSDSKSSQIYKTIDINANGNVFSGLTYFNLKGKNYFLFALPKEGRTAGSVYITDDEFTVYTEVYSFDVKNKEPFAYSYPITVNVTDDYADVLIAYEWSRKEKTEGIQLDKIRIKLKQ